MTRIKVNNSGKSQTRASFTFCRMTSLKEKLKKKRTKSKDEETKKSGKKNWNRRCFVEWCQRGGQRRRYRMACACMLYGCCVSVNNTMEYIRIRRMQIKYAVRVMLGVGRTRSRPSMYREHCVWREQKDNKNDKITFIEKVFLFKRDAEKKKEIYGIGNGWRRGKKTRVRPMLRQPNIYTVRERNEKKNRGWIQLKKRKSLSLAVSCVCSHSCHTLANRIKTNT